MITPYFIATHKYYKFLVIFKFGSTFLKGGKKIEKKNKIKSKSTLSKEVNKAKMFSVEMNANMSSMMSRLMMDVACKAVTMCAEKYGFEAEEALRSLDIRVIPSAGKKVTEKKSKVVKVKSSFPLPFSGAQSDLCCQALRQNNGLYTQCQDAKKGNGSYCKSCQKLADKSEDGIPEYGTITQRMAVGPFEYTDPKGRKPTAYTKVMKKYKLTKEQVLEEAIKFGMEINPEHFEVPADTKRGRPAQPKEPKEPKGAKGRPKKSKKVINIEGDDEDLFASLVASASEVDEVEDNEEEKQLAQKKKDEEKAAAKEAEKAAKLAAKEAEKLEKAEKLAQEKLEKAQKLAQEKADKLAAKEAEKAAKKESKPKAVSKKVEEPEEEETFKKCGDKVDGKSKYIRSEQSGIVYDLDIYTKTEDLVPVGKWNAEKKEIVFSKATIESDEESDEELEEEEVDE